MRFRFRDRALRLLGPLRAQPAKARRARDRVLQGMREVGVLLVTFAALDAILVESPGARSTLLLFLLLGGFLFVAALAIEWRWGNDD